MKKILCIFMLLATPIGVANTFSFAQSSHKSEFNWGFISELRSARQNAMVYEEIVGDTRGFDVEFQKIIDHHFSMEEQQSLNNISHWTFKANRQSYTWADLNGDSIEDVMLRINHTAYCGTVGCQSFIFFRTKSGFKKAAELMSGNGFALGQIQDKNLLILFSNEDCLVWNGQKFNYRFGSKERIDLGWNPHGCGGNFSRSNLNDYEECKDCHHSKD